MLLPIDEPMTTSTYLTMGSVRAYIHLYLYQDRDWYLVNLLLTFLILSRVTHLEELAFWLYLLHQNPDKEAWFSSWEYRLWYIGKLKHAMCSLNSFANTSVVGSVAAIIGMPLTALITRKNLETVRLATRAGGLGVERNRLTVRRIYLPCRFGRVHSNHYRVSSRVVGFPEIHSVREDRGSESRSCRAARDVLSAQRKRYESLRHNIHI